MNKFKLKNNLFVTSFILLVTVIPAYKLKSRLGVDVLPGGHTPDVVEKWTGGLIKARWVDRDYIRRPQIP